MPNWCECDLMVEGPAETIAEFLKAVRGENGAVDFDRIIPYPEKYKEMDRFAAAWDTLPAEEKARTERLRDGYNSGGYEWCVENWGTKWSACRELVGAVQEWGIRPRSIFPSLPPGLHPCPSSARRPGGSRPCALTSGISSAAVSSTGCSSARAGR